MLEGNLSLNENIDHLFFQEGAALRTEYDFIFRSLFRNSKVYRSVVELLANSSVGMSRQNIQEAMKMEDGGFLTEVLDNRLEQSLFLVLQSIHGQRWYTVQRYTDRFDY